MLVSGAWEHCCPRDALGRGMKAVPLLPFSPCLLGAGAAALWLELAVGGVNSLKVYFKRTATYKIPSKQTFQMAK